ncbi:MAG: hypothetical protein [Inoviridae sp.]|nr:MAG: hypothetical protein [Inoviridae sp.]
MNITKMISVFKKIAAVIPLLLFICGLISFTVAGFLANKIIGYIVFGTCLIILSIILGMFREGD